MDNRHSTSRKDVLEMLKTIAQDGVVELTEGSLRIQVGATDAMAARILEFAAGQWPQAAVGTVAAALNDALWWQKTLYSLVEPDTGEAGTREPA